MIILQDLEKKGLVVFLKVFQSTLIINIIKRNDICHEEVNGCCF
ncbi:unnamed protein product [Paramecium pentaurelia]|uniref:Uncharacterized protein n=1 Tax=Paramecium pentaurelia TaxID=43138 RepID=A0A8S1YII3_9CILI|nr:unnamed protein product [Paramecium pentaurelia]CAD8213263.1 unnamed protein product [Paramecium pentaurelia]